MPKKKQRKLKNIKKDLWTLIANHVKKNDGYKCFLCGVIGSFGDSGFHCSHILPKGLYPRYEFEEWNLKTLCMHCHLSYWHKDPLHVAPDFKKKHPKRYKKAMDMAKVYDKQPKYTREMYMELTKRYTIDKK